MTCKWFCFTIIFDLRWQVSSKTHYWGERRLRLKTRTNVNSSLRKHEIHVNLTLVLEKSQYAQKSIYGAGIWSILVGEQAWWWLFRRKFIYIRCWMGASSWCVEAGACLVIEWITRTHFSKPFFCMTNCVNWKTLKRGGTGTSLPQASISSVAHKKIRLLLFFNIKKNNPLLYIFCFKLLGDRCVELMVVSTNCAVRIDKF